MQFDDCDFISHNNTSFEVLRFSVCKRQSRRVAAKDYNFSRPAEIEFLRLDNSCPSMLLGCTPFPFHLPLEASDALLYRCGYGREPDCRCRLLEVSPWKRNKKEKEKGVKKEQEEKNDSRGFTPISQPKVRQDWSACNVPPCKPNANPTIATCTYIKSP